MCWMGSVSRDLAGSQLPPGPIPAGKKGTAPPLLQGPVPALFELPFLNLVFIFFIIVFIFIVSWLKSFSLIKDDSASRVPGMA